jgi:signal peptidase II
MMLPYLLILLAFAADRLTKWWVANSFQAYSDTRISSFFTVHPTYNSGIAFGLLQGIGPTVGWLSIAIVIGLAIYLVRVPRSMRLLRTGLALLIGGALGNLIDRVSAGQVLDFIQTSIRPGVFNVADVMIQVGVLLSLVGSLLQRRALRSDEEEALAELAVTRDRVDEHPNL